MRELLREIPRFTKPSVRDFVRQTIEQAYHQADAYGLTGLARVDFFALYEFTRRKGGALHAWQPRLLVAPFLNPEFIRAVFGFVRGRDSNAFHRHIVAVNTADWVDVPYFDDLEARQGSREQDGVSATWKRPSGRENYDGPWYWRTTGKPLIDEALSSPGLWPAIFERDSVERHWQALPDELVILSLLPHVMQEDSLDWTSRALASQPAIADL